MRLKGMAVYSDVLGVSRVNTRMTRKAMPTGEKSREKTWASLVSLRMWLRVK